MENANKNEKVNINDELLEDISGGTPGLVGSRPCAACGKHVPKVSMELHHARLICKSCMLKISNG